MEGVALRFLRGGLKCDPSNHVLASRQPGIFEYFFGTGEGDRKEIPQMVDFELVNNAYHVLDSLLLGLATVLRKPADKVRQTKRARVVSSVTPLRPFYSLGVC